MTAEATPSQPPRQAHQPNYLDMGRPLSGVWMEEFVTGLLRKVGRARLKFSLRITPAINYTFGREVETRAFRSEGILSGVSNTAEAIDRLIGHRVLDESVARDNLHVAIKELYTRPHPSSGGRRLGALVWDHEILDSQGYVVSGEKLAIQSELGLDRDKPNANRVPLHHVTLGTYVCTRQLDHSFWVGVYNSLPSTLDLDPVSPVMWDATVINKPEALGSEVVH